MGGGSTGGGASDGGGGGTGGAIVLGGGGAPTLGAPAEVTTVLIPRLKPAWPLGEWHSQSSSPNVVIDCGTSQTSYQQVY